MKTPGELICLLDRFEKENPDPIWAAADIRDAVITFDIGPSIYRILIKKYGGSRAPAVVGGIAWCLKFEAMKKRPNIEISQVLDLGESLLTSNYLALDLCLQTLKLMLQESCARTKFKGEAKRIENLIFESLKTKGPGVFPVLASALFLVEELMCLGMLETAVPRKSSLQALAKVLFLRRGEFREFRTQAETVIQAVSRLPGKS